MLAKDSSANQDVNVDSGPWEQGPPVQLPSSRNPKHPQLLMAVPSCEFKSTRQKTSTPRATLMPHSWAERSAESKRKGMFLQTKNIRCKNIQEKKSEYVRIIVELYGLRMFIKVDFPRWNYIDGIRKHDETIASSQAVI